MRRLTLVLLTALVALPFGDVDAQIIRPGGPRLRDPENWVSGGIGLQQGWTVTDGSTASRWDIGDSQTFFASFDHSVAGGVTVGVRGSTASTSLRYVGTGSGGLVSDADARVSQALAVLHVASGRGLHSVIELAAGATLYSGFRDRATGVSLEPRKTDADFTFVFGYGIGYRFRGNFQLDVVQDLATALHQKTGLAAGDDSSVRISVTRLVARVGFGG